VVVLGSPRPVPCPIEILWTAPTGKE